MSADPLLRVNLEAGYGTGHGTGSVLRGVRFELERGQILGLVGSSGAGKSTLVLSLLGLLPLRGGRVNGEVILDGEDLLRLPPRRLRGLLGSRVALIPQSPMTALNAAIRLESHFKEAWRAHRRPDRDAMQTRVRELLAEMQLPTDAEFLRRKPTEISVGQAQRVLIALALLHQPALLIADEPTSALDPVTQTQIVHLLKTLNRRHNVTLLYISHDLVSVLQLADRIAVLDAGTIVENLPVGQLDRAQHPATLALLNALPVPAEVLLRFRDGSSAAVEHSTISQQDGY